MSFPDQFDIFHGPITVGRPEPLYKIYKLRRKTDGLFSTGGTRPRWDEVGRSWGAVKAVNRHLSLQKKLYGNRRLDGITLDQLEIVVFDVTETERIDIDVGEIK